MAETPEQIERHIANLTEFETKFGEFVTAVDHEIVAGEKRWSGEEMARRKREISALAAKADKAMKASGVGQLAIYNPPAIGGGLKSGDLPSQVFDFVQFGDDDGLTFQREILGANSRPARGPGDEAGGGGRSREGVRRQAVRRTGPGRDRPDEEGSRGTNCGSLAGP